MCFIFHPLEFNRRYFRLSSSPFSTLSILATSSFPYLLRWKCICLSQQVASCTDAYAAQDKVAKSFYSSRKTNIIYLDIFYARRNFQQNFSEYERKKKEFNCTNFFSFFQHTNCSVKFSFCYSDWNIFFRFDVFDLDWQEGKKIVFVKKKTQTGLCKRKVTWLLYEREEEKK